MDLKEREKTSTETGRTEPADSKPLMVMVAAALAATAMVLGIMWVNNTRQETAGPRPVAERGQ